MRPATEQRKKKESVFQATTKKPTKSKEEPRPKPSESKTKKCVTCNDVKLAQAFYQSHSSCRQCETQAEVDQEWLAAIKPARILLVDLETAPSLGYVWGNWQTNVIATSRDWFILSVAFKWLGDKDVQVKALPDFNAYKTDKENDRELISELWKLLDEADVVIAHNADRFDIRKTNARFLVHGFQPPSPYQTVDTLKIARRIAAFDSNRLDDLGRVLGVGRKTKHSGAQLWFGCMSGDKAAWNEMQKYNKQDVALLEKVYLKLRPWHKTHPNLDRFLRHGHCPVCESDDLVRRGWHRLKNGMRQRWKCESCGHWSIDAHSVKVV